MQLGKRRLSMSPGSSRTEVRLVSEECGVDGQENPGSRLACPTV